MWLLVWSALALASDFTWHAPGHREPVQGECPEAVDLVVGQPLPGGLLDEQGRVKCYATVVPTSDLARLIQIDVWAAQASPRGRRLELELDWQRERYDRLSAAFDQPAPLLQRPAVQRTLGRVETLLVVGVVISLNEAARGGRR